MLQGFDSRKHPTSVGPLHVLDGDGKGTAPPMLVFHGVNSRATNYRLVLPSLLAHSQRVVAPDLPGHGFSARPDRLDPEVLSRGMTELLDQLDLPPMVVFGNSLGGVSAIRFAQERPELVRGLVLCSPGGAWQPEPELRRFLSQFDLADNRQAAEFVDKLFVAPPWHRRLIAPSVRKLFQDPLLRGFMDSITPDDLFTPDDLAGLDMPILLLWGRGDRLMPMEHYRWYADHLPSHAVIEDPVDFGHSPYQDRPAKLAERLIRFARELA